MGQRNCRPEPGDLIEIDRGVYKHWAVYVGDGYVIHVTKAGTIGSPPLSSRSSSKSNKKGKVKKELLEEVVGDDKWRVNNKYDRSRIPFPVEEIIKYAEESTDTVLPYNFLKKNCEHFVTKVRYGEPVS
ncbi:HRSL1 enzyme, partial [Pardalotus punctatus]|nr:HRSL1 enzyme [Pardalotus punctatus]